MSSSGEELVGLTSDVGESGDESFKDRTRVAESSRATTLSLSIRQSNDFFRECRERKTSYKEHAIRAAITATSFVGSALFFFGVKQFVEEEIGDDQLLVDVGIFLGIAGLTLSALPLAGMGVTTAQDMEVSTEVEEQFLEPTKQSKVENGLRVVAGFASAAPIGGLSYYVLINSSPLLKWGGTITAFLGLACGTVPSMLKLGKSAPNELEVKDGELSAAQLATLKRMHSIMLERIDANQYKIARLSADHLPQDSCELLNIVLADQAPSYGRGLDAFIIGGTTVSFLGMMGYAGSTGLFVNPLFKKLPNIPSILGDDITTLLFIIAFGNLMRLSCKDGFSDQYKAMVAINSQEGLLDFLKKEMYAYPFFPIAAPAMAICLGVLGAFTGFTNASTCYAMTLPVLNAITFNYWEHWGLETTTEVIRWVTAVCGFINSDFFNGRGSIIAVLNVFLLQYGHILLKDEELKEVLKNFNGSQLYLRRFKEKLPVGKSMEVLAGCDGTVIESVIEEATKEEEHPSITRENWEEVITSIGNQRAALGRNPYSFLGRSRRPDEELPNLPNTCPPEMLLIQSSPGENGDYGTVSPEEGRALKSSTRSSMCAIM